MADFAGIFEASFAEKQLVKNGDFVELPKQISLESDWFCADLRNVFNETRRSYNIYSGFIPQYEIVLLNTFTIQVASSSIFIQLHVVFLIFEILFTTILHTFNI